MHSLARVFGLVALLCGSGLAVAGERPVVHFIAGPPSHGWGKHEHEAGCRLLADALAAATPGFSTQVHTNGWPEEAVFHKAAALVIFGDGGPERHVAKGQLALLERIWSNGVGVAVIHYALEPASDSMRDFGLKSVGGCFEPGWSVNPVWKMKGPRLGDHPVTRGVTTFDLEEEWYYHIRFREGMVGITPLLSAVPPPSSVSDNDHPYRGNPAVRQEVADGKPQHLAWAAVDPNGRRGFGFTGGHFHTSWAVKPYRKLVLNGIAWVAGADIPPQGIESAEPIIVKNQSLIQAVALDDVADIRNHLRLGADVNGVNKSGWSPLHYAAVRNKVRAARALLESGAKPDLRTNSGKTPLHFCAERGLDELAKLLIKNGATLGIGEKDGWTPLHYAAAHDRLELVRTLIAAGADVNALSTRGGTPLHEGAASAAPELLQHLIDHGADPTIKAGNGKTALDYARELGNEGAVKLLERLSGSQE